MTFNFMPTPEQMAQIKADRDPPRAYAAMALGIPKEQVTATQRQAAKVVLFGTTYGQTGWPK